MHISADVCGGRKSLVNPVMRQNISSYSVLSPEIVMSDDAYIGGRSENNIKCVVHDDLGWKNRTTRYILPCQWLYEWFSQFHRCRTYSVLSRSHSVVLILLFTGKDIVWTNVTYLLLWAAVSSHALALLHWCSLATFISFSRWSRYRDSIYVIIQQHCTSLFRWSGFLC